MNFMNQLLNHSSFMIIQVFAADMFTSKFCDGLLNHHIGMQFRNKVRELMFF